MHRYTVSYDLVYDDDDDDEGNIFANSLAGLQLSLSCILVVCDVRLIA